MNIFDRLANREAVNTFALGSPALNIDLRLATFAEMTGGRGFRQPKKAISSARGDRKRARSLQFKKTFKGEHRPLKHMHAAARRRALLAGYGG